MILKTAEKLREVRAARNDESGLQAGIRLHAMILKVPENFREVTPAAPQNFDGIRALHVVDAQLLEETFQP